MPGLNDLVVELEDWLPRSRQLEHEYSDLQEDWRPDSEEVDDLPALQERWRILEAQRMTLATRALQLASAFANAPEPQVLSLMLDVFAVSTDEAGAPSRKLCLQLVEQLKKYPEAKLKNATKRWLVHTAVDLARIDCLASLSNTPFMKALCAKLPQGLHDAQSIVRLLLSKLSAEVFSAVMAAFRNGLALGPDALACLLKGSEANLSADLAAALVGQVRGLSLLSVEKSHTKLQGDNAAGLVRGG